MNIPPPAPGSMYREEWDLLHELRSNARLLQLVSEDSGEPLHIQKQLRREFPDALVRAALTLADLRRKAQARFSRAADMWFDRPGLEQATPEAIASYKAQRFHGTVRDLCCGIGSQAIALAGHCDVEALDDNPLSCLRTTWNAEVYERAVRVSLRTGSIESFIPGPGLVHLAPVLHRAGMARAVRLEDYIPDAAILQRLAESHPGGAITLSPAANFGGKFPGAEIELVSLHGECKEATVWFGELAGPVPWRATALPSGASIAGNPLECSVEFSEPLAWVYDPDPAVVRAGLADVLAVELGLFRLDAEEEYLTGPALVESPFVQGFEVLAELGNNEREIRGYFRTSCFGEVEIKCRHLRIDAAALRRKLPLPGAEAGVLLFVRVAGRARALVCRRAGTGDG